MSMTDGNPGADAGSEVQTTAAPPSVAPTGQAESWLSTMPEDLKASKSLSKFTSPEALARSYLNAETLIGRDKIPVPRTDDEFKEAYKRLGCPEDTKGYGLTIDPVVKAGLPENITSVLEGELNQFLPKAQEIGLNKKQASALFDWYLGNVSESHRQANSTVDYEMSVAENALKNEFGKAFPAKLALATRALTHYGSPALVQAVERTGLGRNADFVRMMARLGEERAEDLGIDKNGQSVASSDDLRASISKAQADPAYLDSTHPQHKMAVERARELFERLTNS